MKKTLALLLLCFTLINCEKDDICPETTETTPKLHIAFYDNSITNEDTFKNIDKLRVTGVGHPTSAFLPGYDGTKEGLKELYLPLKTNADITQYVLHRGYKIDNNVVLGNPDTISINYSRKDVYVSRACGYKTIFENVAITLKSDSDNWIKIVQEENENQTVEHETDIHYKIYH